MKIVGSVTEEVVKHSPNSIIIVVSNPLDAMVQHAYNISGFEEPENFKANMDEWMQMMKSTKPAPGEERVTVAGQPEAEMEVIRRRDGIPLHPEVADWIRDTCAELSVNCPF